MKTPKITAQQKYDLSLKSKGLARITMIVPKGEAERLQTEAKKLRLEYQLDLFKKAEK